MYLLMFTMMMLMINSFFIMMNHPLAITLLIIIQTLMICITTGSISYSFWFSYILFLIFLGGMLVLFIYITSLASNEMFQLPMKTMIINFMMYTTIILIMTNMYNYMMSFHLHKNDSFMNKIINITMENNNLNQLYNYPNFILTIITITYLLITLICTKPLQCKWIAQLTSSTLSFQMHLPVHLLCYDLSHLKTSATGDMYTF